MIHLQQIRRGLLVVLEARVQDYIETEDLIAHGIEDVPWLGGAVVMDQVWLDRDQGLHNDITDLLLQKVDIEGVTLGLAFSLDG